MLLDRSCDTFLDEARTSVVKWGYLCQKPSSAVYGSLMSATRTQKGWDRITDMNCVRASVVLAEGIRQTRLQSHHDNLSNLKSSSISSFSWTSFFFSFFLSFVFAFFLQLHLFLLLAEKSWSFFFSLGPLCDSVFDRASVPCHQAAQQLSILLWVRNSFSILCTI